MTNALTFDNQTMPDTINTDLLAFDNIQSIKNGLENNHKVKCINTGASSPSSLSSVSTASEEEISESRSPSPQRMSTTPSR